MKNDIQIQQDVQQELKWEPFLNSAEIGVAVKNGVVTLSGIVDSYAKKTTAEKAAKRVAGVKALAEDILLSVSPREEKSDAEIAAAALTALKWNSAVRDEKVKIKVENGNVKLDGEVEWEYQRKDAKLAIENLEGVKSVLNLITLKPKIDPINIQNKINNAFHRSATLDSKKITVDVIGSTITLRGTVRSLAEKDDAEIVAWNAPGVLNVKSELLVEEPAYAFED